MALSLLPPGLGWRTPSLSGAAVAGALQIGLVLLGLQTHSANACRFIVPLLIPLSLWGWTTALRRYRLISDLPLSNIASAAQGYVELQGIGQKRSDAALISRVTLLPCLWYRYRIEERRGSRNQWTTMESGTSDLAFEIGDRSGTCVIDPEGAEVISARTDVTVRAGYRYTEEMILPGDPVYALGEFTTVNNADGVLSEREDVSNLLAEWKKDPTSLIKRFDRNGDGQIDLEEWELARAEAKTQVLAQHREQRVQPGVNILRRPVDGRVFFLSNKPPEKLVNHYRWLSWAHLAMFFLSAGIAARMYF